MYTVLMAIHVFAAVLLVLVVLIQAGRSGGLSGLMGGGGGDALFSATSQQAGLRKATIVIALVFMFTSLGLTILSSRRTGQSVFQKQLPGLPPVAAPAAKANQSETSEGEGHTGIPPTGSGGGSEETP